MSDVSAIAARLEQTRECIARAAARAGRDPGSVTLVGASKRQPAAALVAAAEAGLRHFGENVVQETTRKQPEVSAALEATGVPPPRWHLIGRLQTNKARAAVRLFDVVESVDSERLGRELERRAGAAGRRLEILIQVNVSDEPQKGGVAPEALPALVAASAAWEHLRLRGLMAVPALEDDPERSRPAFAKLRGLADSLRTAPGGAGLRELSMGMSRDFEIAIEEGATIVRIGTALFGAREEA